ncbi:MAG: hypothetical protein J6V99_08225 [Neisseriaceae bacterium]|nr:hypothetical protein [Neisseriaceae bacterium]
MSETDKASIRRIYEENLIMTSAIQNEVRLLREEVQNLSTDLENAQKNHKKWIEHLERVFSETIVGVFVKELDKQIKVRQDMENLVKQLNAKFEMVQKPQKRRWF